MRSAEGTDAIGAATHVALYGDWQHQPPCPRAPHHTQDRTADQAQVRTIFATEPSLESEVRQRIDLALTRESQETPTGEVREEINQAREDVSMSDWLRDAALTKLAAVQAQKSTTRSRSRKPK